MFILIVLSACLPPAQKADSPVNEDPNTTPDTSTPDTSADLTTWSADVAPLIEARCASCHQPSGSAVSFLTYTEAYPYASLMASYTQARTMPPWILDGDGDCQTYRDDRSITDEEIAIFSDWALDGAPEGDSYTISPPASTQLAEIDYDQDIGGDYTPDAGAEDAFRCFLFDLGEGPPGYLTGFNVIPTVATQTHHGTLYQITDLEALATAQAMDAQDSLPGWSCTGGANVGTPISIWHSGMPPAIFPEGTGLPLQEGLPLLLWIHYYTGDGVSVDRSRLQLDLEDEVEKPIYFSNVALGSFTLEPGQTEVSVTADVAVADLGFPENPALLGVAPHMHQRGTSLTLYSNPGEDDETCLERTRYWDYHHQEVFFYQAPISLDPTATLRATCTWDTSSDTETITSGSQAAQEMCLVALYGVAAE